MRNDFLWHVFGHDVLDIAHLPISFPSLLHKSFLKEHLFIQELAPSGQLLEAIRDLIITITDDANQEVILAEPVLFIQLQAIVVVNETTKCRLQFADFLIVHCDANCKLWRPLTDAASRLDL